jgi:glycosyltransferase involved in cell wall biosynthesis
MAQTLRFKAEGLSIGFICNEYPPRPHGGIGSSTQDLAEGVVIAGGKATVMGVGERCRRDAGGVAVRSLAATVVRLPWRFRSRYERWRLGRLIAAEHRQHQFDLLEAPDYQGWLPSRLPRRVPVVVRLRGTEWLYDQHLGRPGDAVVHALERNSLLRATHWAGVSHYSFKQALRFCGLSQKPGGVVYNSVDTEHFSPGPQDVTEAGLIVFINSLSVRKGLDTLLLAMPAVLAAVPRASLAIIGQAREMPRWENLLQDLPGEQRARIQFVGFQDRRTQVVEWLRRAQVCCYPSRAETFGLGPVEAMAVGKSTIYSHCGPGPEVIEDGVSGWLCDPDDPSDLAAKLIFVLRNPEHGARVGKVARRRVLERFDRKNLLAANLAFYRACIGQGEASQTKAR